MRALLCSLVAFALILCGSCTSQAPVEPSPSEATLGEKVAINGEMYRRVVAKPTTTQDDAVITISIPVSTSGGNIIIADEITIAGKTYTANCGGSSSSTPDDVGNTFSTATNLTVPVPTSPDNGSFWRSSMYRLTAGDVDVFRLRVTGSRTIDIAVVSGPAESTTDTRGQLLTSSGRMLAENDDTDGFGLNFFLFGRVAPGTYYVKVQGATSSTAGTYDLVVGTWTVAAGKPVVSASQRQDRMAQLRVRGRTTTGRVSRVSAARVTLTITAPVR